MEIVEKSQNNTLTVGNNCAMHVCDNGENRTECTSKYIEAERLKMYSLCLRVISMRDIFQVDADS